jgi:hypothetical protein
VDQLVEVEMVGQLVEVVFVGQLVDFVELSVLVVRKCTSTSIEISFFPSQDQ